jgi:hypothetical protein
MPTAQARMTRARGLHATRGSILSDYDMSSLPERRIACRFFLFRWHCAHTCHALNFRTATFTDRWPGSQARMPCAACHGHMGASGEPLGAAATRRLGRGVRALHVPSMQIVLYSEYRPLRIDASLLAVHAWRALSRATCVCLGSRWRLPHATAATCRRRHSGCCGSGGR